VSFREYLNKKKENRENSKYEAGGGKEGGEGGCSQFLGRGGIAVEGRAGIWKKNRLGQLLDQRRGGLCGKEHWIFFAGEEIVSQTCRAGRSVQGGFAWTSSLKKLWFLLSCRGLFAWEGVENHLGSVLRVLHMGLSISRKWNCLISRGIPLALSKPDRRGRCYWKDSSGKTTPGTVWECKLKKTD